ncbi:hypothetical protein D3C78_1291520 [compost metagenome]
MHQLLVARNAPELEGQGIARGICIGIELHHGLVVGEPGWMRLPCVQIGVFQQAQAPALCTVLAATAQHPVAPVVRVASQVFPCQGRSVKVQDVEIGGAGKPLEGCSFGHGAALYGQQGLSLRTSTSGDRGASAITVGESWQACETQMGSESC